jgi:hypothetical protein
MEMLKAEKMPGAIEEEALLKMAEEREEYKAEGDK